MILYTPQFLESLQSKNETAFTKLYQDTVDMFYRYIKSHYMIPEPIIQDILSETYIKIRNSLTNLDDSKKISSYLRTILKNTTKDYSTIDFVWDKKLFVKNINPLLKRASHLPVISAREEYGDIFKYTKPLEHS